MSLVDYPFDNKLAGRARGANPYPNPQTERREISRTPPRVHPALSFLTSFGVPTNVLIRASAAAAHADVRPERALITTGLMREDVYYRSLARHLGLRFVEDSVALGDATRFPHAITAGVAPLADALTGEAWLLAPEGRRIDELLTLQRRGALPRDRFAITTPAHLARLNRPGFTGGQNSRRIAHYGTDTKEEDLEAVFP